MNDPVAVVVVKPIPERPQPCAAREVGEQRGLAIAGIGQDEDDALIDLGGQPVEETVARQRLVPESGTLDFRELYGVAVHPVAVGSMRHRTGPGMPRAGDDRCPHPGLLGREGWGGANDTDWPLGVQRATASGHGPLARVAHPPVSCDLGGP
jgi:hypothetical protein